MFGHSILQLGVLIPFDLSDTGPALRDKDTVLPGL